MSKPTDRSSSFNPATGLLQESLTRRGLVKSAAGAAMLTPMLGLPASSVLAQEDGTVSLITAANPASWDLTTSTWSTWEGIHFLYDRLLTFDENEDLQPGLATAWEISEDGLEYTLTLRDSVTFHDGTPFNAEAVRFNIQRHLDQVDSAFYTSFEPVEEMEIVDDATIVLRLREVRPNFIYEGLPQWGALQLSPTAYEEGTAAFDANPVGTGPFRFESYEPGSEIRFVRNEEYWAGAPALERVIVRIIPEPSVQLIELESGNVDISEIQPIDVAAMEAAGLTIESTIAPGANFVSLNVSQAPTDELAVRQAIARAIDRDAIIETVLFGYAEKSRAGVNSASAFYSEEVPMIEYNPEEAAQILEDPGWVMGANGIRERDGQPLTVHLASTEYTNWGLMNQIIQEQLASIGIGAEISSAEWNAYLDAWRENQGGWNVTFHSQGSITGRTAVIQASWVPNDYWTITQIDDATAPELVAVAEELQALSDEFETTLDEDQRFEIAVAAQSLFQEHQLTVWLWHGASITAIQPDVQGYTLSHAGRVVELSEATVA
ncbi:MAG: ABC transporter substrate-binding protein [Chloroflexota bacterium]|nr:ABC transporter substrate-binding protein [Chloroflexota bacterium]